MSATSIKISFEGALRRLSVPVGSTYVTLKEAISNLLEVPDVTIGWVDEEGDFISIHTDQEVASLLQGQPNGKVARFEVKRASPSAERAAEPEKPPAPKLPFEDAARLLGDPEVVHNVLLSLFASPILSEAIAEASQLYISTSGDVSAVFASLVSQLPMLQVLVEDVLQSQPVLLQAFQFLITCPPSLVSMFFPMAATAAHCGGEQQGEGCNKVSGVHFRVFCDGCATPEQQAIAMARGFRTRRGFIRGLRFHSLSVHDFDLCEMCHATGSFEATHGPFETLTPPPFPAQFGCGVGMRGGHRGHWMNKCHEGAATKRTQAEAAVPPRSAPSATTTPNQWSEQAEVLASLGFKKLDSYLTMLEEEKGDLVKVINRIFQKEAEE